LHTETSLKTPENWFGDVSNLNGVW